MDQNLMKKYNETYGCRYTRKSKKRFRNELIKDFQGLGYSHTIVSGKHWLSKADNLVFGNIKHAKNVVAVTYETPQKMFWWNSYYYPLDGLATANKTLLPTFGLLGFLYFIMLGCTYLAEGLLDKEMGLWVSSVIMIVMIVLMFYVLLIGVGNKHNANRFSASIAAALEIAGKLDKDERRNTVFVFLDAASHRHLGARIAAEDFLKQVRNPNVIVLSTIAKGESMQIGYNAQNKKLAQDINRCLPADQRLKLVPLGNEMRTSSSMEHFSKAVVIAAGDLDKRKRLCVKDTATGRDKQIQEERIDQVVQMVSAYLGNK